MSTTDETETGPQMICATGALRTGPTRIGHIAGNVTLPRTIELPKLIAVVAGILAGLMLTPFIPGGGIQQMILAGGFGGGAGWILMSFSPLRGESMLTWLGLQMNTFRRTRRVNGRPVIVAVGSIPISRETLGAFRFERSAVRISPGTYDDRGVLIKERNITPINQGHRQTGAPRPPLHPAAAPNDGSVHVPVQTLGGGRPVRPGATPHPTRAAAGQRPAPQTAPTSGGPTVSQRPAPAAGRPLSISERRNQAAAAEPAKKNPFRRNKK